jgi:hypothetical protein
VNKKGGKTGCPSPSLTLNSLDRNFMIHSTGKRPFE